MFRQARRRKMAGIFSSLIFLAMAKKRKDNIFTNVLMPAIKSNTFDLSHDVKMSFQMGELVPTCVMECLPGDSVEISVQNMLRFAPLIAPVMHRVDVTTHYFFVPNRILWADWEDFITRQDPPEAPFMNFGPAGIGSMDTGSLGDYLGIPPSSNYQDFTNKVSPFTIAAYMKIFDEYYRDQNLVDPRFVPLVPGHNAAYETLVVQKPLYRAWQHDYFTSCLPWAQKGDSVQIPLTMEQKVPVEFQAGGEWTVKNAITGGPLTAGTANLQVQTGSAALIREGGSPETQAALDPNGGLVVDVQADATDINTLRRAFRLQEWLERQARGGTRYIEQILAHWGQRSSDSRLQRPEYIGGSKQNMVISEVLATAQSSNDSTDAEVAVGQMGGHGISVGGGNKFSYHAEEHGFIIGIINVQPVTAYQDGLHKSLTRFDPLDYAWPTFANIGEQEVRLKELQMASNTDPETLFGYIPRYSEYKFMNSRVAGDMRTNLSFWHLGRIFDDPDNPPALNEEFITSSPSTRIFAVTDSTEDHIYSHIFNIVKMRRKLPRYGIPTI